MRRHRQGKLLSGHRGDRAGALHLPAPVLRGHHREERRDCLHRLQRRPRGRRNCVDLNYCTREALNIPSGERYELCRSVHAEANAIISAARRDTLGATLYMVCVAPETGALIPGSTSCSMCRRLVINARAERGGDPPDRHGV